MFFSLAWGRASLREPCCLIQSNVLQMTSPKIARRSFCPARLFGDWNRHVLDGTLRLIFEVEDARTVLKLHRQLYDVIITEPSNPWTVGIRTFSAMNFINWLPAG